MYSEREKSLEGPAVSFFNAEMPRRCRQLILPKLWYLSSKLHGTPPKNKSLLEHVITFESTILNAYSTWKPTYTLARLMVGDHHRVKRRFGIWFKPDLWAFVSFLYFMDSSNPDAFSLYKMRQLPCEVPIHSRKFVSTSSVCLTTEPSIAINTFLTQDTTESLTYFVHNLDISWNAILPSLGLAQGLLAFNIFPQHCQINTMLLVILVLHISSTGLYLQAIRGYQMSGSIFFESATFWVIWLAERN